MKKLSIRAIAPWVIGKPRREAALKKIKGALEKYRELNRKVERVNADRAIREISCLIELIHTAYPQTTQTICFELGRGNGKSPLLNLELQMVREGGQPLDVMLTNLRILNARIDDVIENTDKVNSIIGRAKEGMKKTIDELTKTINRLQSGIGKNAGIIGALGLVASAVAAAERAWLVLGISAAATLAITGYAEIKRRIANKKAVEKIECADLEGRCSSLERVLDAEKTELEIRVVRANEGVLKIIDTILPMVPNEVAESIRARVYPETEMFSVSIYVRNDASFLSMLRTNRRSKHTEPSLRHQYRNQHYLVGSVYPIKRY